MGLKRANLQPKYKVSLFCSGFIGFTYRKGRWPIKGDKHAVPGPEQGLPERRGMLDLELKGSI